MMKRLFSFLLALCLTVGCCTPVFAVDSLETTGWDEYGGYHFMPYSEAERLARETPGKDIFWKVAWPEGVPRESAEWHSLSYSEEHGCIMMGRTDYNTWMMNPGILYWEELPMPPEGSRPGSSSSAAEPPQSSRPEPSSPSEPVSQPSSSDPEKPEADKTKLEALYQQILSATNNGQQGEYTDASWQNLMAVSKQAVKVINDEEAQQTAVDSAYASLATTWNNMKKIDRTALKKVIDETSYQHKYQGPYSDESWESFQTALKAANTAYAQKKITQNELDNAKNTLQSRANALKRVDTKQLKTMISMYEYLLNAAGEHVVTIPPQYTTESMRGLRAAITAGQQVLSDTENHSQKKVDDACSVLSTAAASLQHNDKAKYNWQDKEALLDMIAKLLNRESLERGMVSKPDPNAVKVADALKKLFPKLGPVLDVAKIGSAEPVKNAMGVDQRAYDVMQSMGKDTKYPGAGEELVNFGEVISFHGTRAIREQLLEGAGITDPDQLMNDTFGSGNYNSERVKLD